MFRGVGFWSLGCLGCLGAWSLEFEVVEDLGFRCLGFRVWGLEFRAPGG